MPAFLRGLVLLAVLAGGAYLYWTDLVALTAAAAAIGVFEVCVVASAVLDYRDARLTIVGWRQAWAVGHATVFVRGWRRARHTITGLRMWWARRLMARALADATDSDGYVVLSPTAPFHGRVIDADSDSERTA